MGKRILLFLLTNILVIATISFFMSLLGVKSYLTQRGIDYRALLIFCSIWGMGGAFISLLMSKMMAKMFMGVKIISPQTTNTNERQLLETIYRLAKDAGLKVMPEVGYYDSPEINAFATGPSRRNSLVAVSSGLLRTMRPDEIEGVLAHEISHVANGDMVTMTLIQGVVNAFAMFLSRIAAYAIATALSSRSDEEGEGAMSHMVYFILTMVFDILFTFLGSMLTASFSRWREFRADAGGANLAGRTKMIAALERLRSTMNVVPEDERAPSMAALKISHRNPGGLMALFASHPPLEVRIARLQKQES